MSERLLFDSIYNHPPNNVDVFVNWAIVLSAPRCIDNDFWLNAHPYTLQQCQELCAGYMFMTYAARGDRNCACQDVCELYTDADDVFDLYILRTGKV